MAIYLLDEDQIDNFAESSIMEEYKLLKEEQEEIDLLLESTNVPDSLKDIKDDKSARITLKTLAQSIINDNQRKGYKVNSYTVNSIANIITKSLLPKWAHGYRKLSITLDNKTKGNIFEFVTPKFGHDFIGRFIDGREPLNAFLHRIPEIKIRMTPSIFDTLTEPNQLIDFFKKAITYYDSKVDVYSITLMKEIRKLDPALKQLIRTTNFSGLVTCPLSMLFLFNDVSFSDASLFEISKEDITAINVFIKDINKKYENPSASRDKIVNDMKKMVQSFRESGMESTNFSGIYILIESFTDLVDGKYNDKLRIAKDRFISENIDYDWINKQTNSTTKYYQEKFGVKKLKKIPADIVAYIAIETESIKDANDKMMIASYCLGKIEIVEWYIELLDTGSKKYIVPHNKPYLENIRTQLLQCYKNIMAVKITPPSERPIIDIKYPAGYEG